MDGCLHEDDATTGRSPDSKVDSPVATGGARDSRFGRPVGSTLVDVEQKKGPSKRDVPVTELAEQPPGTEEPRHLVPARFGGGSARKDGQRGEKEFPSGFANGKP